MKAIGITNQRETTVAWRKDNGLPLCNAIVWHDARTKGIVDDIIQKHPNKGQDVIKLECGLPVSTYFSASKVGLYFYYVSIDHGPLSKLFSSAIHTSLCKHEHALLKISDEVDDG